MAERIDQRLGNYRLVRLLGKGGFAEVYLGEHQYLKTLAAIKILRTTAASETDLEDFLQEAQTVAQLVHPHIVRVLEFGLDGETPFLVMDYAPNGTLRQRHPKGTQLPLTMIIPYVKHVAEALQYAHEEKFIHRDVKPENMLLGRGDAIMLSDFGIALIAQSSRYQSTQDVTGTVAYMAPEQIQGKPRPASDQYSLGVVVYEWLSGERPFHGSFAELCTQHLFASPPPLHGKLPTLASAVEQVVMTALSKDPKQRFVSVQDFAAALEQASQTEMSISIESAIPPSQVETSPVEEASPLQSSFFSTAKLSPKASPRKGISRRTTLIGLAGVAVVSIAGSTLALLSGTSLFSIVPSRRTASPPPSLSFSTAAGIILHGNNYIPGETLILFIDKQSPQYKKIVNGDGTVTFTILIDPNWPAGSVHTLYLYRVRDNTIRKFPFTIVVPVAQTGLVGCVNGADRIILGPISEGSTHPVSKTITLCTIGSGPVNWTARWDQRWLHLNQSGQIMAPQNGQVIFSASANGLKPGAYTTSVIFSSRQSSVKVSLNVTFVVSQKAASGQTSLSAIACVSATPQLLSFVNSAKQSNTLLQRVTISNCGDSGTWSASASTGNGQQWLL